MNIELILLVTESILLLVTLGFPDENGAVVMFKPDIKVPNGAKLF